MLEKRNKILLAIIIAFGIYCYGLLTARYNIFPNKQIIQIKLFIKKNLEKKPFQYSSLNQTNSNIFTKNTKKEPFTFIVYGDSREPSTIDKELLLEKIKQEQPDFIIHLGDLVLRGDAHHWKIFDLFHKEIRNSNIPFFPVLGNHEYHLTDNDWPLNPDPQLKLYFDRFPHLNNNRWYSFKYGDALFLNLDTNTDYSKGSYQHKWLLKTLKNNSAKHIFISYHHPSYTKTNHGRKQEKILADIFSNFQNGNNAKIDIVFSGHVHDYEIHEHNNIKYIVSGGGGSPLRASGSYHYLKVTVYPNKIISQMIAIKRSSNKWQWTVNDSVVIKKPSK